MGLGEFRPEESGDSTETMQDRQLSAETDVGSPAAVHFGLGRTFPQKPKDTPMPCSIAREPHTVRYVCKPMGDTRFVGESPPGRA